MTTRAVVIAIAAASATWLMMLLILGSVGLGSVVSGDASTVQIADAFVIAKLGAAAVAFGVALWMGWRTGLTRGEIGPVLAGLLLLDMILVGASILVGSRLGPGEAATAFLVVSASGLQFAAVGLAALLASRADTIDRGPGLTG